MTKAVIYARVSTDNQTVQNQIRELRQAGKRLGWTIVGTFTDQGISGAKGREKRPAFDRLLKGVARREFDLIAAWSVDRLGRSLQDLLHFLEEIHARGVNLYLHTQGIDTSTPGGRALFQMMGVFGELERSILQQRVRAGLARARAEGKQLGRPRVPASVTDRVRAELRRGTGVHKTGRLCGCGSSVVQRVRRSMQAEV